MFSKKLFKLDIPNIITCILLLSSSIMLINYSRIIGISVLITGIVIFLIGVVNKLYTYSRIKYNYITINKLLGFNEKDNLQSTPLPILFCKSNGETIYYNNIFNDDVLNDSFLTKKQINKIIDLYNISESKTVNTELFNKKYTVFVSEIPDSEMYVMYFIDDTYFKDLEIEYNATRPSVILVSIDSVDEASANLPHSLFTSYFADIEKMITQWFTNRSCCFRKIGDDRFFAVTESKNLNKMIEQRFNIMDDVRNYKLNNKNVNLSLSIGVGTGEDAYSCEQFAKQALEMARGRGGDQTAIKNGDNFQFFGGVSEVTEKSTQIRTRTVAKSIEDLIKSSSDVMIIGHKNADLDSLGSSIGLAGAVGLMGKRVKVVVNDKNLSASTLYDYYSTIDNRIFLNPYEAKQEIDEKTLLIVVDTMRSILIDDEELYKKAKKIIVIDHHRMSVDHIKNADLFYHEPTVSSVCEMVTNLIQYFPSKPIISIHHANCLLSGIYLDTKNFTIRTGVKTFEAAAYLKDFGADTIFVRKLFSSSSSEYQFVNSIISNAEFYSNIAISYTDEENENIRVLCSKAADKLLEINNVDASFVVFKGNDETLNVSARSYGKINVQVIMEEIGGGGHQTMAAAQLKDKTFDEIKQLILETIQ